MDTDTSRTIQALPFDIDELDALLAECGIDVLLVTSKHNLQYLLGGYRFFFFDFSDAIGVSRYLPILLYLRGRPFETVYIGNAMENSEHENGRFWCNHVVTRSWGTMDAVALALDHLTKLGAEGATIGVESSFIPADALDAVRSALPSSRVIEAHLPLERLRACKRPGELERIRIASDRVVDSMLAVFAACRPGMTKRALERALRREEIERGLVFEYCLITAGTSHNRAPSEQVIQQGDIISLDSGGRYEGYIGDLCRMGIVGGGPDPELEQLLAEIETIQQGVRPLIRAGVRGGDILTEGLRLVQESPNGNRMDFVAHGMGMIAHEAPRLSDRGPVIYPAYDADLPLRIGMVLSVETTLPHSTRGYIKLEDTLIVTESGYEPCGDHGRGWNVTG